MSQKLASVKDVVKIIHEICQVVFRVNTEEEFEGVFGINGHQLEKVIEQIILALPDRFFFPGMHHKLEEIKAICAREFIFFQVQEKYNDVRYEVNLKNFIRILVRDLQRKM